MEAAGSSETLLYYHITIQRHNPEEHDLNHCYESIKSRQKKKSERSHDFYGCYFYKTLGNILCLFSRIATLLTLVVFVMLNSNCATDVSNILASANSRGENLTERMHGHYHLHLPHVLLSEVTSHGRTYSTCRYVHILKELLILCFHLDNPYNY
jgi:hypothetical protein